MVDRQPTKPNRIKITFDDGTVKYGTMERADEPTVEGTPLNKATLFNSLNTDRYSCDLPSKAFELLTNEPVVTVPASGWTASVDSEGYYTNQVTVAGMKAEYSPIFSLVLENAETTPDREQAFSSLKRVTTFNGYVIFKSTDRLEIDLKIKLKGV